MRSLLLCIFHTRCSLQSVVSLYNSPYQEDKIIGVYQKVNNQFQFLHKYKMGFKTQAPPTYSYLTPGVAFVFGVIRLLGQSNFIFVCLAPPFEYKTQSILDPHCNKVD